MEQQDLLKIFPTSPSSVFTKIVVTDSIYLSEEQRFDKLRILSASEIFAETIKRIAKDEPISDLFELPSEQH
mgnify:CR=1 FL=1